MSDPHLIQPYHPDIQIDPHLSPTRPRMQSKLSHLLDLTSPLTRQKTPEAEDTVSVFKDPREPTYGMTISSPAGSPGLSPDFVEEFDLNPPVKEGVEDDGSKIILGFDTTADALLAFNHVLKKMTFSPNDHIYMAQLPSYPLEHESTQDDPEVDLSTPSSQDRELFVLRKIRQAAMERVTREGGKLLIKGCKITPVIVHSDQPAKALCQLAQRHRADLIVLGRRKLSKFRVVGAGSVGNYCLAQGGCNVLIVQK